MHYSIIRIYVIDIVGIKYLYIVAHQYRFIIIKCVVPSMARLLVLIMLKLSDRIH